MIIKQSNMSRYRRNNNLAWIINILDNLLTNLKHIASNL